MKKLKMTKIILSLIFLSYFSLNAQSPFDFLDFDQSARDASLAGSGIGIENDMGMTSLNPALFQTINDKKLSLTFLKNISDINSGYAAYQFGEFNFGRLSTSAIFNSYGSFDYIDDEGNSSGSTFGASNLAIAGHLSGELDSNFYYGVSLKFVYSGIESYNTTALAVDAGLFYRINSNSNFGFSIRNAGSQLTKFNGESNSLPLDVRLGANHQLKGLPVLVNFSFHHLANEDQDILERFGNISIGGEISFGQYVKARIGYNTFMRREISSEFNPGISGLSGGLGIVLDNLNFDYGFTSFSAGANQHRFTLNINI
jgi:hypothetical protein